MPCRDYETDYHDDAEELKEQCDRLARIACKAMAELEANGIEDMLLLKDDETREWWAAHKEADRKAREKLEKEERRVRVKAEALAKLSAEEREVLGIDENGDPLDDDVDGYLDEEADHAGYQKVYDHGSVKVYMDKQGNLTEQWDDDAPFYIRK